MIKFVLSAFIDNCKPSCTRQLDLVCGTNGKTYANPCYLQEAACRNPGHNIILKQLGPCPPASGH